MKTILGTRSSQSNFVIERKRTRPLTRRVTASQLPVFRMTWREPATMWEIHRHRALTSAQISTLLFPSPSGQTSARARERLKDLYHHRYVGRIEQASLLSEGRKPFVYVLDQRGAELLEQLHGLSPGELDWRPQDAQLKPAFLEHLLATNDVRIAITLAAQRHGWSVDDWRDDRTLKSAQMKDYVVITGPQGAQQRAAVVPDGYLRLSAGEFVYHAFLEIDRATVVGRAGTWGRRDWSRKVSAYLAYYESGVYQARYQAKGLRILTVTTTPARMAHLKTITEETGGRSRFWFTTFDRITPQTALTQPIWLAAGRDDTHALVW